MVMVKKLKADVVDVVEREANSIYTLTLQPQGRSVRCSPGQFLHLALDDYDPSGAWPESRCFSLQNPPGSDHIKLTYAVKGDFTRNMMEQIQPGRRLWLKLPYGDLFSRPHSREKTIFIAGGTGITPFLSLLGDMAFAIYQNPVLFFGLREERYDFYQDELTQAQQINPHLQVRRYLGVRDGFIDINAIIESATEHSNYFISGPVGMIHWCRDALCQRGVKDNQIFTDDWE